LFDYYEPAQRALPPGLNNDLKNGTLALLCLSSAKNSTRAPLHGTSFVILPITLPFAPITPMFAQQRKAFVEGSLTLKLTLSTLTMASLGEVDLVLMCG